MNITGSQLVIGELKVRRVWDVELEKWWFSIIDIIGILTEQPNYQLSRNYWKVLKNRLVSEGNETVTNCNRLKLLASDGKMRLTDVADIEQMLRLIQSIPSKKAEAIKLWLAEVGRGRIDESINPELAVERAIEEYRKKGYPEEWITQRMRSTEIRKDLTAEWKRGGVKEGDEFAILTNIMTRVWSGMSVKEYKDHKELRPKDNLRDHMSNVELVINSLAEVSATEISKVENPASFQANKMVAIEGADIARSAKEQLENRTGKKVVNSLNAKKDIKELLIHTTNNDEEE